MSVYIYTGGLKIVKKSGVGQAILHQQEALRAAHIKIDEQFTRETQIVHINTVFSGFAICRCQSKTSWSENSLLCPFDDGRF